MNSSTRICGICALAAVGVGLCGFAALRADPEPATVATCDVYSVLDKLVNSDHFKPLIEAEQQRIADALAPLEEELQAMAERGRALQPDDPQGPALAREFEQKRQAYIAAQQQASAVFDQFVATKYTEAYEQAKSSIDAVAEEQGFDYVVASRTTQTEIKTDHPQRVIEAVLARPMLRWPEGVDITDDVVEDLKLD